MRAIASWIAIIVACMATGSCLALAVLYGVDQYRHYRRFKDADESRPYCTDAGALMVCGPCPIGSFFYNDDAGALRCSDTK